MAFLQLRSNHARMCVFLAGVAMTFAIIAIATSNWFATICEIIGLILCVFAAIIFEVVYRERLRDEI